MDFEKEEALSGQRDAKKKMKQFYTGVKCC